MTDEAEKLKYTEYTSAFTSRWFTVCLALNVTLGVMTWGISPFIPMLITGLTLFQFLFYKISKGMAGYKSLLSMMTAVMEGKNKKLGELMLQVEQLEIDQRLADEGTNSDETCLTVDKGEKDE